jgi:hypothetical protein
VTRTLTASLDEVRTRGSVRLETGGCAVLLAIVDGDLHAADDACRHRGTALSGGLLRAGIVTCPAHLWQYDEALTTYPVVITGDTVEVTVPDDISPPTLREVLLAHARAPLG